MSGSAPPARQMLAAIDYSLGHYSRSWPAKLNDDDIGSQFSVLRISHCCEFGEGFGCDIRIIGAPDSRNPKADHRLKAERLVIIGLTEPILNGAVFRHCLILHNLAGLRSYDHDRQSSSGPFGCIIITFYLRVDFRPLHPIRNVEVALCNESDARYVACSLQAKNGSRRVAFAHRLRQHGHSFSENIEVDLRRWITNCWSHKSSCFQSSYDYTTVKCADQEKSEVNRCNIPPLVFNVVFWRQF